jgi:2-dehydro-3-deoxyphosphogluconate aldolase / (4S)-4-hydroxy-2-oxoglutarate aldolase
VNVREILHLAPVVPVITISELEQSAPLARALVRGGLPVLEVTLRTACALQAIEALRAAVPEAIVGAGTLTRPRDFADAAAAGAQFGVTPGVTADLIAAARKVKLPLLPGIMTPSELIGARAAGFEVCKLFPAQAAGGLELLRALAGPFPDQLFCPTGGITPQNAAEFLALPNVICVGGSWMAPAGAVQARDWKRIEDLARQAAALRPAPPPPG